MKKGRTITLLFATLSLLLSGCGLSRLQTVEETPTHSTSQTAPDLSALETQLKQATQSVSLSLRTLAKTQEASAKRAMILDTAPLITPEGGMGDLVMLDWSGPVEPLLSQIANLSHYQFKILGNPPAVPVLVNIMGEQRMIADVLKDASLQINKQASIMVYPALRVIELRYQG